jgi:hypothetical protein
MMYEILVRGKNNPNSAENLIRIESGLTTRGFEQWLLSRSLLGGSVARWSILQSKCAPHFDLATQAVQIEARIAELTTGVVAEVRAARVAKAPKKKAFQVNSSWMTEAVPAF